MMTRYTNPFTLIHCPPQSRIEFSLSPELHVAKQWTKISILTLSSWEREIFPSLLDLINVMQTNTKENAAVETELHITLHALL